MWPGHHGQWQISNINYRNLFCCHVCIAVACLPPGGSKTPKSRLQTHLLYLIWVLCSSLSLSPPSSTDCRFVCCDVCEGEAGRRFVCLWNGNSWKRATKWAFGIVFCLGQVRHPVSLSVFLSLSREQSKSKREKGGRGVAAVECWTKWVLWWAAAARRSLWLLLIYVCFVCLPKCLESNIN